MPLRNNPFHKGILESKPPTQTNNEPLADGFNKFEKNILVHLDHFPKDRGGNNQISKTHHPATTKLPGSLTGKGSEKIARHQKEKVVFQALFLLGLCSILGGVRDMQLVNN